MALLAIGRHKEHDYLLDSNYGTVTVWTLLSNLSQCHLSPFFAPFQSSFPSLNFPILSLGTYPSLFDVSIHHSCVER